MDGLFASFQNTISRVKQAVLPGDTVKKKLSGIGTLSDEVIQKVASLLDDRDRLAFRLTCRKACVVVGIGTTSLSITNSLAAQVLSTSGRCGYGPRLLSRFPNAQNLHCSATGNIIRAFFHNAHSTLRGIGSLDMMVRSGLTDDDLKLALVCCPNLMHLGLDAFAFSDPFSVLCAASQLSSLTLRLCKSSFFVWNDKLISKLSSLQQLRKLELHSQGLVRSEGIALLCRCSNLEYLSLHQLHNLTHTDISLLANLQSLHFLQLHECSTHLPCSLSLLCSLPNIRTLSLDVQSASPCSSICSSESSPTTHPITYTSSFMSSLPHLTSLRNLSLHGYLNTTRLPKSSLSGLTGFHLTCPSRPPTLQSQPSTSTSSSTNIPSTSPSTQLCASLSHLPFLCSLREMSLTKWYYLDSGILQLLPQVPSLQLLQIACLQQIADDDLLSLAALTKLRSLKLSTRQNGVTPGASSKLKGLLWGLETYELGQEALPA